MTKTGIIFLILGLVAVSFISGVLYDRYTYQPPAIEHIQYVDRVVEVPAPITKVETITTVEKIKEVPLDLRPFRDTDELEAFLKDSMANAIVLKTDGRGKVYLNKPNFEYDCDNYAMALVEDAINKGFLVNLQYVENYYRQDSREFYPSHMINNTVIGNRLYFIEPQKDEFWLETRLD